MIDMKQAPQVARGIENAERHMRGEAIPFDGGHGDAYPRMDTSAAFEAFTVAVQAEQKRRQMVAPLATAVGEEAIAGATYMAYLTAERDQARSMVDYHGGVTAVQASISMQMASWQKVEAV
jgi:hypothetical protein